jgi:hypothetical protein
MNIDSLRSTTVEHLTAYAGLPEVDAKKLVSALCDAAQAELLTMISGSEPYPTSMSDLRALRLRYICQAAERLLSPREVAILFRTTDSSAQTLLTRMERLYPAAIDRYLDALVAKTGYWKAVGNDAKNPRIIIDFPQLGAWEHATTKLERASATDIRTSRVALTIETPAALPDRTAATDLLGITPNRRK